MAHILPQEAHQVPLWSEVVPKLPFAVVFLLEHTELPEALEPQHYQLPLSLHRVMAGAEVEAKDPYPSSQRPPATQTSPLRFPVLSVAKGSKGICLSGHCQVLW